MIWNWSFFKFQVVRDCNFIGKNQALVFNDKCLDSLKEHSERNRSPLFLVPQPKLPDAIRRRGETSARCRRHRSSRAARQERSDGGIPLKGGRGLKQSVSFNFAEIEGYKSERRMPRLLQATKDVVSCAKPRGTANRF